MQEVMSPGKLMGARILTLQQWLRKIPVAWPAGYSIMYNVYAYMIYT
jgi:hypothetical protein